MTIEEDKALLRRHEKALGLKPWDIFAPWERLEGDAPWPRASQLQLDAWRKAKALRTRMRRTSRGREILAECEEAYARVIADTFPEKTGGQRDQS